MVDWLDPTPPSDSEIDKLRGEVARLRDLLAEGVGHHGSRGMFCLNGKLENETPCPTCDWMKRVRVVLEGN